MRWGETACEQPDYRSLTLKFEPRIIQLAENLTIGRTVSFGNDITFEKLNNPAAPEHTTILLLRTGLSGTVSLLFPSPHS